MVQKGFGSSGSSRARLPLMYDGIPFVHMLFQYNGNAVRTLSHSWRRGWREIRCPQFDAHVHVAAVGDEDVPHQVGSVVDGEDLKAAPEECVGGIGNLDFFSGNSPLLAI